MLRLTQALLALLESLDRGTSRVKGLLTSLYIRFLLDRQKTTALQFQSREDFHKEVEQSFNAALEPAALYRLSAGLKNQYKTALLANPHCMLPSYNHQLPHGRECGRYLALDVGGSTFRVALIKMAPGDGEQEIQTLSQRSYRIDHQIKLLKGTAFFDWMATKIEETTRGQTQVEDGVLSMGMAWSFPIEQTSLRSGLIQQMGKGFHAADGLLGQDLGDVLQKACARRHLNVQLQAIVNDSAATLLSKAYTDPTTRYGLILGTGVNFAVHLPVDAIAPEKFGNRPESWYNEAEHVIVNTELSMFGKDVLSVTKWDIKFNAEHHRPDFQPIEYMVGGRCLGELARLVLIDGIRNAGVLGGIAPPSLEVPYSLDTELIANMQVATIEKAQTLFTSAHPTTITPSSADIKTIQLIAQCISRRASGIIAAAVHAFWALRSETEGRDAHEIDETTVIACNGSVIQHYPGFRASTQAFLNALLEKSGMRAGSLELRIAHESSLHGAAVAVACVEDGRTSA